LSVNRCKTLLEQKNNFTMSLNRIFNYFQKQQSEFDELLKELVSIQTYSGNAQSINRFMDDIEKLCTPFNPEIERQKTQAGDILTLTFFPDRKKHIIFLAHADTVKVSDNPIPLRIEHGKLFGNGSFDMKNGICLFYFTLKALQELNIEINRKIQIILTPDEETGSSESMPFLLKRCKGAEAVLLPEPCCPDGGVKVQRKGVAQIRAELTGKAAHSGIEPERGIDANRALTDLISRIDQLLKTYPQVHFNPGIISGGTSINIVSPYSYLEGELRSYSNNSMEKAIQELERLDRIKGVQVKISCRINHPAMEFNEKIRRLYQIAKQGAEQIGYDLPYCFTGGASDGCSLSAAGIPVLDGLGMKGGGAHSENEFVELSDFPFRAAILANLCLVKDFGEKTKEQRAKDKR